MFVNSKWLNLHLSVCFRSASSFKLHCACNGAFVTYSTACHLCYHHLRHHRLRALLWQASRSMQVQWNKWVLLYLVLCVCWFHMCVCVYVCVFVSHMCVCVCFTRVCGCVCVCVCVCVCGCVCKYLVAVSFDVEFVWCWEGMGWGLFCCCCWFILIFYFINYCTTEDWWKVLHDVQKHSWKTPAHVVEGTSVKMAPTVTRGGRDPTGASPTLTTLAWPCWQSSSVLLWRGGPTSCMM